LLDNIITSKSFTPDQPGTFTGGNFNLQTKSFPEQFTLKFTTSFSVNTQSSFIDNFLSHPGGETDWLGYDDGTREIPDILADPKSEDLLNRTAAILARRDDEIAEQVDRIANSVSPFMEPTRKSVPLDHGFSLGIGNQYSLFGKPLGFIFSASYNRSYSYYQNAQATNWFYNGNPEATSLSRYFDLRETRGIENPKVGGMIGFSYKLSPLNQLSFNTLYNHNTDKLTLFQQGEHPDFEIFLPEVFQSRTLQFRERQIINYQLSGEHSIPAFNQMKIEWTASLANSSQEEPDLRFFASEFNPERDEYAIRQSNYNLPTHFWRDLQDDQVEGKIDFTLPVLQSANKGNKLQFGGLYFDKQRDFEELRFSIVESPSVSQRYEGDEMAYFGPENTGLIGETESGRNRIGNFIDSDTRPENSYIGSKEVWASYLMGTFQLAPRWKFIGGARVESTDIRVQTKSAAATEGVIDQLDVLPSASLIYSLTENMNIRAAYSKTIARPNMRELAPFASFEFIGDAIFIGNPNLDRTRITNADLRWEIFPAAGELFALSAYYKDFDDPIVQAFTNVSNPEYRYVNVDQARVYGLEIEMRKGLGFIADDLSNFKFSSNMSLIRSSVDIPESELMVRRLYNPGTDDTRPFQGQSDFIVNAALAYLDRDRGWDAALSFNIFGDRLAVVGQEGTPDIFEQSRGQLDLTISKDLAEFLSVRVSASNLLNAKYRTSSDFKGQEFVYRNYLLGRTFGLSVSYLIN
ncbi:MAG: TonB-dependent receptor, partial [Saprospiraceae bacterium]|nr:TonB-dependent receptor [Saprospiraceae bacterium]